MLGILGDIDFAYGVLAQIVAAAVVFPARNIRSYLDHQVLVISCCALGFRDFSRRLYNRAHLRRHLWSETR
jgi:hypothetical protein